MELPTHILVPLGQAVPLEYRGAYEVSIPAIRPEDVVDSRCEIIDVTSHVQTATWRSFIPGRAVLTLRDGREYSAGPAEIEAALHGGGKFRVAILNPIAGPITEAEHLENIEAEEQAAACEAAEWY